MSQEQTIQASTTVFKGIGILLFSMQLTVIGLFADQWMLSLLIGMLLAPVGLVVVIMS